MSNIAIINNTTGELVNCIVAELTDECPEGYRHELIPEGKVWDGKEFVNMPGQVVIPLEI
jgi:hypothetical protein